LSTGIATLDRLTGGGIPAHSLSVLTGSPGSGKTVLAMQVLFAQAREGRRCVYFTTLSEPALKVLRYMRLFSFFDESLLDKTVHFVDLGSALLTATPAEVLEQVRSRLEADEPDFVVFDSFKAVHDFVGHDIGAGRSFAYELAVSLAAWGATTLLLGEYTSEEISLLPEFAIADGIIQLSNERHDLTRLRQLEILKLRGAAYVTGTHFLEIRDDGIHLYPRVGTVTDPPTTPSAHGPLSTGLPGLDDMLRGGLPAASTTLIEGGTGTGKTLLSLRFLLAGVEQGQPGIYFGLEEGATQLRHIVHALGWDLEAAEATGRLTLQHTPPIELNPDKFLREALASVRKVGASRVVFDSSTSLAMAVPSDVRFRELLFALSAQLRALNVTSIFTAEIPELLGSTQLTGRAISPIADNVILLRYVEIAGRLDRAISVLKARGVAHAPELRRFTITPQGPEVGPAFTDLRGVLTGVPELIPDTPSLKPDSSSSQDA
jgi:circadian clock protein KaiC